MQSWAIAIGAKDGVTPVVARINASLERITRPTRNLGGELSRLGKNTGLSQIGAGLTAVANRAAEATRRVTSLVPALAAVTGVGSIAGVLSLTNGLAKTAMGVGHLAEQLGDGSRRLQSFQLAGRMVGIEAGQTASSLSGLAQTIEDASTGRNVEAAQHFRQLGIEIRRLPNGSVDAIGTLKDIANVVARLPNAQARRAVASAFGIEEMLPLLVKGGVGIDELQKRVDRMGLSMSAAEIGAGSRYHEMLVELDARTERFKQTLGMALLPAVIEVTKAVNGLVKEYGGAVSSRIGDWAKQLAEWIRSIDWTAIGDWAKQLAERIHSIDWTAVGASFISMKDAFVTAGPYIETLGKVFGHGGKIVGDDAPTFDIARPLESAENMRRFYSGEEYKAPVKSEAETWKGPGILDGAFSWIPGLGDLGRPVSLLRKQAHLEGLEDKYGLPRGVLDGMWKKESERGQNMTVSRKGAEGHFQFMPATGEEYGLSTPADRMDFGKSSDAAARYMKWLLGQTGGDLPKALMAYNGGIGTLRDVGPDWMPLESKMYAKDITRSLARYKPAAPEVQRIDGNVTVDVNIKGAPGAKVITQSSGAVKARVGQAMEGAAF